MTDFLPASLNVTEILNIVLLLFLLAVAIGVIIVRDLLASAILAGIFSLLMAVEYLVLDAPDVAITEAAVGAGIGTVIFLCSMFYTGRENSGPAGSTLLPFLVITAIGMAMLYATQEMPGYGLANAPAQTHVAPYYITESPQQTGIPNVVTSILASYRGFDTLGETAVVFTAAMSVMLLLGNRRRRSSKTEAPDV